MCDTASPDYVSSINLHVDPVDFVKVPINLKYYQFINNGILLIIVFYSLQL